MGGAVLRLLNFCTLVASAGALIALPPRLPPRLPPPGPTIRKSYGGGDGWSMANIDLQTASELLTNFSRSHESHDRTPDFSCNPICRTSLPQGLLGIKKHDDIKLVCHVIERQPGKFCVTNIATPAGEGEAGAKLMDVIRETDELQLDDSAQLRWKLEYRLRDNSEDDDFVDDDFRS